MPPPSPSSKKVLRMFDGILEHAVRAWSDIITVIWAEARKYWFSKLGQTATHCQIFSDRREQRRRGRQDNTRLKRGEGGGSKQGWARQLFFLQAGRAEQEKNCSGRGAGHARTKLCRSGWEDGGSTRPRSHLPHKCRQFCTFRRGRALRCWEGDVRGGARQPVSLQAGLPSLVPSLILPTPPTLSQYMDKWTSGQTTKICKKQVSLTLLLTDIL